MRFKFFVFIIFLFITLGCAKEDKSIYEESWQDEVLVAQDCGLEGLSCCADKDVSCQYGLECCLNPENKGTSYCAKSCSFGSLDRFCRDNEPKCDDGLACDNGYCVECGITNGPCCTTGTVCNYQNSDTILRNECVSGKCSLCGAAGEPSCLSGEPCITNQLLNNGYCLVCGKLNKPCCSKNEAIYCDDDLRCELGFCE